jgi:hypothetical protein
MAEHEPTVIFGRLPRMTHPDGRYWDQPAGLRDRVRIFWNHATIDEADWDRLPRYDSSFPSGKYAGKVWRRGHFLCWYGRDDGRQIRIGAARALVQTNGSHARAGHG